MEMKEDVSGLGNYGKTLTVLFSDEEWKKRTKRILAGNPGGNTDVSDLQNATWHGPPVGILSNRLD